MVLAASYSVARAQNQSSAYEAELDKAVSLSCDRQVFIKTLQNAYQQFVNNGTLTQAQCDAISVDVVDAILPRIIEMNKELWRDEFTLDELKQIVAWLSSPVGKKMLNMVSRTSEIQQSVMQDPVIVAEISRVVAKYIH